MSRVDRGTIQRWIAGLLLVMFPSPFAELQVIRSKSCDSHHNAVVHHVCKNLLETPNDVDRIYGFRRYRVRHSNLAGHALAQGRHIVVSELFVDAA